MLYLLIYVLFLCITEYFCMRYYLKIPNGKKLYIMCGAGITVLLISVIVPGIKGSVSLYNGMFLTFISILLLLGAEDLQEMQIDKTMLIVLWATGIVTAFTVPEGVVWKILLFSFILTAVIYLISVKSGESVGKGDVFAIGAVSMCFTFNNVFSCMIYSLLPCLVFGIMRVIVKKDDKNQKIPFIPFLVFGMVMNLLFI